MAIVEMAMGMTEFGKLIKNEREGQKLQSKELARRVGIGTSTMSEIESGDRKNAPPPEVFNALGRELAIPKMRMLLTIGYLDEADLDSKDSDQPWSAIEPALAQIDWTPEFVQQMRGFLQFLRNVQRGES